MMVHDDGNSDAADIERFRGLVSRRLGLNFDETRVGFLLRSYEDALSQQISAEARTSPIWMGLKPIEKSGGCSRES